MLGSSITADRGNPCAPDDRNTYLDYRRHLKYDGNPIRTKDGKQYKGRVEEQNDRKNNGRKD